MPQPGRNGELRRAAWTFFHFSGGRIATIGLWITLCVKMITRDPSGDQAIYEQIKCLFFICFINYRDVIAIFNSVIPCVDIKFMPWRWTKPSRN
ncbi:hypothetical protein F3I51_20355 [Pantoea sp. M_6]|nr:hypothetical protein F3I51_20355 [Pantoea sp. M_6]